MVDETLEYGSRVNAIAGWLLAAVVALAAAVNVVTAVSIWSGFALLLVAVVVLPAVVTWDWTAMVPWPLVAVATITVSSRLAYASPEATGHVAIATLAIVITIELDVFTSIQLSRRFLAVFAFLTTMAIEALWIIVQFFSDKWFGTRHLTTQTALQHEIVIVTVVSFAIGVVFYWYLARLDPLGLGDGSWRRGKTP